uniref:Altered inheritance of mitochondria protein 24, mitochondrial n=1 Tax=Bionectria ochroleuca TaxID=29856 RepID=A0A8H7TWC7_BIOOC
MTHPGQSFEKFAETGKFEGGNFAITHRDANAVLTVTLEDQVQLLSETGAMIHMSGSIKLDAKTKVSWKRFLLDDMTHSTYTGPGTVTIGPPFLGDVFALPVNSAVDTRTWVMRREAALAWTSGVTKTIKKQNFKNTFWHDEPYHVYELGGMALCS